MLSAIAIVPSAPLMVPELASSAAAETEDMRAAAVSAAAALPRRWIAVGVAPCDGVYGAPSVGTFAGYGVDVRVGLSGVTGSPTGSHAAEPAALPLCALITGWLRGRVGGEVTAEVRALSAGLDGQAAYRRGAQLRSEIDAADEQIGVLVVADGANTLTAAAPGGHDPESAALQDSLDDALAAGAAATLSQVAGGAVGRVALQALSGLCGGATASATQLYRGAPYGVGYFVGAWRL